MFDAILSPGRDSAKASDSAIYTMAIRAVLSALPRAVPGAAPTQETADAYRVVSRALVPRLLSAEESPTGTPRLGSGFSQELIDVLTDLINLYGPIMSNIEIEATYGKLVRCIQSSRAPSQGKKRAVLALSLLATYISDSLLDSLVGNLHDILQKGGQTLMQNRLYITIVASLARSIPARFGPRLHKAIPQILDLVGEERLQKHLEDVENAEDTASHEFAEVSEACLVALESCLASCPREMADYASSAIDAFLRYLVFDPNYAEDEEEEDEMEVDDGDEADEDEDNDFDDDFEDPANFDDDDASWKVRRGAAKALHTLLSTMAGGEMLENGTLYRQVAPRLVKRFSDREDTVRQEVIATMALLIRKSGDGLLTHASSDVADESLVQLPQSRKRRRHSSVSNGPISAKRVDSSVLMSPTLETVPSTGSLADLALLTPSLVKASVRALKEKSIPTKQAIISLLDDLVQVQPQGLADYLDQLAPPILATIAAAGGSAGASTGGNASVTPITLRTTAIKLVSDIARTHSSKSLQPHLSPTINVIVAAANDKFYKISSEALGAVEELVKSVTPPRSRLGNQRSKEDLRKLYDVITDRMSAANVDAEVRQRAIHAIGVLLARTSTTEGLDLLSDQQRRNALNLLRDRLNNEVTRLSAIHAIETTAAYMCAEVSLDKAWISAVAAELSKQVRKTNRKLRSASINALKNLVLSPATAGKLDRTTIDAIIADIGTLMSKNNSDPSLLSPAFLILSRLVKDQSAITRDQKFITDFCYLLEVGVPPHTLDAIIAFIVSVGETGQGRDVMSHLLQTLSVKGDPGISGKVLGSLLVAGGNSTGVTVENFKEELGRPVDDSRLSLALAVLGEAGLRLGARAPLSPQFFLQQLEKHEGERVALAAAVALGRAGAGNVPVYMPVILDTIKASTPAQQYFLLQSVREILHQVVVSGTDISNSSMSIWIQLLVCSEEEDNRAICAECMGRLALIDPRTFVPKLEASSH